MRRRPLIATALSVCLVFACEASPTSNVAAKGGPMNENPFVCNGMNALDVLRQIEAHGADLTRSREAVFYFYGSEERLGAFQQEIERLGFSVRPTSTDPGRIARIDVVVSELWLRGLMPRICEIANRHAIEYDGWEASLPESQTRQ